MARVKRGVTARARHKKILKQAKGYYNARRKVFRVAKQAVTKACSTPTSAASRRSANFRTLWIAASTRPRGRMA
jgi:large subunit ribosomal protein L20